MKKLLLISMLPLLLCAGLSACQQDDTMLPVEPTAPAAEQIDPEYRAILTAWGFDGDDMVAHEDGYIVEGDVFVSRDQLEEAKSKTRQTQAGSRYLVERHHFKFALSFGYLEKNQTEWEEAFKAAATEWGKITGCGIKFNDDEWAQEDVIRIMEYYNGHNMPENNWLCNSTLPHGSPGNDIYINTLLADSVLTTAAQRKMTAVHLLGHNLGLAHTFKHGEANDPYFQDGYGSDELIEGTPVSDNNSVMNFDVHGKSFSALSANDKLAMQILYPDVDLSKLTIAGPNVANTFTPVPFEIVGLPADLTVDWSTNDDYATIIPKTDNKSKVEISFVRGGYYNTTIRAKILYKNNTVASELEKSVSVTFVWPENMSISGAEDTFAGTATSYTLTGAPKGVSIQWSIVNGTGDISGQGTYNASITFNERGIVTLKAKITSGANSKEIIRTVYVEGKVDPEKLKFMIALQASGPNPSPFAFEQKISSATTVMPHIWKIGSTGTIFFNAIGGGIEMTDQSWILERSWICEGVEIIPEPSSLGIPIKIADNSNYNNGPSYQATMTYVLRYESIRGGVKQLSKTAIFEMDDTIPYIEVQAPSTGLKAGQQYTVRVHQPKPASSLYIAQPYGLRIPSSSNPAGSYSITSEGRLSTFYFTPKQTGWFTLDAYKAKVSISFNGASNPTSSGITIPPSGGGTIGGSIEISLTVASRRVYVNP